MTIEQRRFSVFLVPAAADYHWAEGVIRELAARYDALPFEPHLTVCSGSFAGEEELAEVRRVLNEAASRGPVILRITGLGATEEYFRTVFVAFADEPRLRMIHEAVRGALPQDSGYVLTPHLSLLYADLPLAAKELAARTVSLDRGEMRFDEVKIVTPDPVAGWHDTLRWQTLFRVRLAETGEDCSKVLGS